MANKKTENLTPIKVCIDCGRIVSGNDLDGKIIDVHCGCKEKK